MNFFKWFFITLMGTFIFFIVWINLYIFIIEEYGAQYNLLGVPLENFQNGYFGFRSFFNAIQNFPVSTVKMLSQSIFDTTNALTGGFPKFFASLSALDGLSFNLENLFVLLGTILLQPFYVIMVFLEDVFVLVFCIAEWVGWVFALIGGAYNIPNSHTYPYPI